MHLLQRCKSQGDYHIVVSARSHSAKLLAAIIIDRDVKIQQLIRQGAGLWNIRQVHSLAFGQDLQPVAHIGLADADLPARID